MAKAASKQPNATSPSASGSVDPGAAAITASAATIAKINPEITSALSAADNVAAGNLQMASLVHQARLAQLTRTAASVTARYGVNSEQAVAARAAVTTETGTVSRVAIVSQQVSTPAPQVTATGWALYGRVYTADSQPASAYCVFLVDAEKAYQGAYGFSYTDATGYFLINFAGTPGQSPNDPAGAPAPAPPTPQLFIEVANGSGLPVYLATTAFEPTLGVATYQNIALPAGGKPIGDPPADIRKVALPPAPKSP
jgi:hypothetical protein